MASQSPRISTSTSQSVAPITTEPSMAADPETHSAYSSSSVSEDGANSPQAGPTLNPQRPQIGTRKASGSIIIPRDSVNIEVSDEVYDEGDARTMSPRRSSEEIEKMGREARQTLIDQARTLQASLLEICDRVESIKSEHSKLEGENAFLQNYIGELMQTTKITSTAAQKGKGKGRAHR